MWNPFKSEEEKEADKKPKGKAVIIEDAPLDAFPAHDEQL